MSHSEPAPPEDAPLPAPPASTFASASGAGEVEADFEAEFFAGGEPWDHSIPPAATPFDSEPVHRPEARSVDPRIVARRAQLRRIVFATLGLATLLSIFGGARAAFVRKANAEPSMAYAPASDPGLPALPTAVESATDPVPGAMMAELAATPAAAAPSAAEPSAAPSGAPAAAEAEPAEAPPAADPPASAAAAGPAEPAQPTPPPAAGSAIAEGAGNAAATGAPVASAAPAQAPAPPLPQPPTERLGGGSGVTSRPSTLAPPPTGPRAADSAAPAPSAIDAVAAKKRARTLVDSGKMREAAEAAQSAIQADPTDAESYLLLGAALQEIGQWKRSRDIFSACVRTATRGPKGECRALGGH